MIEFKRNGTLGSWNEASNALTVGMIRLYGYTVRINGEVQNIDSKQFEKEFNKDRMWEKLND